jgi:2-(3-amino-3-carboxypropyl)histidine synthase
MSDPSAEPQVQPAPEASQQQKAEPEPAPLESAPATTAATETPKPKQPRRIIRRRRARDQKAPEEDAIDPVLLQKLLTESSLPTAYSFEISKTVQRIQKLQLDKPHIALQMPEGLLMYATVLADLYQRVIPSLQVSVLGDVTYGACCVDDLGAAALGAHLLVHFGHSCLVPMQHTVIPCLYIFTEIQMDINHLVECLHATLEKETVTKSKPHVYLLGTIQFRHAFVQALGMLQAKGYDVSIPQAKPLSPGEVLGCTSPSLHAHEKSGYEESDAIVCFVADGRFHLESTLISNPHIRTFYRYDPYGKSLTEEEYAHEEMKGLRQKAVLAGGTASAKTFGILMGTLGRQGNPAIVQRIQKALRDAGKRHFLVLLSEISPAKLALLNANDRVDCWVQVACPRLSVDWGHFLSHKPVLSPYELFCALEQTEWRDVYPMDYYSYAGGPWSNYYEENKDRQLLNNAGEVVPAEEGQ